MFNFLIEIIAQNNNNEYFNEIVMHVSHGLTFYYSFVKIHEINPDMVDNYFLIKI